MSPLKGIRGRGWTLGKEQGPSWSAVQHHHGRGEGGFLRVHTPSGRHHAEKGQLALGSPPCIFFLSERTLLSVARAIQEHPGRAEMQAFLEAVVWTEPLSRGSLPLPTLEALGQPCTFPCQPDRAL